MTRWPPKGARSGLEALAGIEVDVCIVGAGPVGLSLAAELGRLELKVLLLESGLSESDDVIQRLSDAEYRSSSQAPLSLAVNRALGGTSWLWGGRCLPLDAIDFETRSWIPESGWPIGESVLKPHYPRAAELLGCGPALFSNSLPDPVCREVAKAGGLRVDELERWANEPRLQKTIAQVKNANGILMVLDTTVTAFEIDASTTRVTSLILASSQGEGAFGGAKMYVFACGGLETTRLLLAAQRRPSASFGGSDEMLGRRYMGHVSGSVADILFDDPRSATLFQYRHAPNSVERRRLTFSGGAQRQHELPNISFYPDNPRMSDPSHGSGILSAVFLLLAIPAIGRRFVAEAIRQMQMSKDPRYPAHLLNVLKDLPATIWTGLNLIYQRYALGRRKPSLFVPSRDGRYPLHYHSEHLADLDSRVRLGESVDDLGMPRLQVDLRFSQRDAQGIARAHEVLDQMLRSSGIGRLEYRCDETEILEAVLAQAADGFHQIGTTRMGSAPGDGIVDSDCKVFGVENLFIAGSSVFRTSGQANPTFSAVALALRLASHLGSILRSVSRPA